MLSYTDINFLTWNWKCPKWYLNYRVYAVSKKTFDERRFETVWSQMMSILTCVSLNCILGIITSFQRLQVISQFVLEAFPMKLPRATGTTFVYLPLENWVSEIFSHLANLGKSNKMSPGLMLIYYHMLAIPGVRYQLYIIICTCYTVLTISINHIQFQLHFLQVSRI